MNPIILTANDIYDTLIQKHAIFSEIINKPTICEEAVNALHKNIDDLPFKVKFTPIPKSNPREHPVMCRFFFSEEDEQYIVTGDQRYSNGVCGEFSEQQLKNLLGVDTLPDRQWFKVEIL